MGGTDAPTDAWLWCGCIAALTWFFSSRPRLFIRVFVPRDELRKAIRGILWEPHFQLGMRLMAGLQFGAGCALSLVARWCRG